MDRGKFFAAVRSDPFGGRLTQVQVEGCEAILDACDRAGVTDPRHQANILAQVYHETGESMEPVAENLNYTTAKRIRQVWPSRFPTEASAAPFVRNPEGLAIRVYGDRLGNRPGTRDGWLYRGQGQIQPTGRDHFVNFGNLLGIDLVGHPERALELRTSADIAVIGMRDGLFTGKRLSDYFNASRDDPAAARAIVNGDTPKIGPEIAKLHKAFLAAIRGASADPVAAWRAAAPASIDAIRAWLQAMPQGTEL